MTKSKLFRSQLIFFGLYALIQLGSLIWRSANLNYNSPFNDEAIYIVIGKMGLFQKGWDIYGAKNWIAGHPYFYPVMAALSHVFQGIAGPRLLNVIFGLLFLETVFLTTLHLSSKTKEKRMGSLLAVFLAAAAPVLYYVSRLATYDMPGFYFLFLGLSLLLIANDQTYRSSKYYFLSALFLIFAVFTKIIAGIFFPLIIIFSFYRAKKLGPKNFYFWLRYFFFVFTIGMALYTIFIAGPLLTYYQTQSAVDDYNSRQILASFWEHTAPFWFFWLIGSIGFFLKKSWFEWLFLTLGGVWILLFHLITGRWFTLDKHTLGSIFFLTVTAGTGFNYLSSKLSSKLAKTSLSLALIFSLVSFTFFALIDSQRFNNLWLNETSLLSYLQRTIGLGDKVLVESGSGPILATYQQNFPLNVTTFDWLDYAATQGEEAYSLAVASGYFDYIQLVNPKIFKIPSTAKVHRVVAQNIEENYNLVYNENNFLVYKRNF
jgi:hypothetical protein